MITLDDNLIFTWIEIGTALIEVILILFYCQRLKLPKRISSVGIIGVFSLFFCFLSAFSIFPVLPWIRLILSFLGLSCLFYVSYDIDFANTVYMTAGFLLLSVIADSLCSFMIEIAGLPDYGLGSKPYYRITYNAISKLLHLILIQSTAWILRRKTVHVSFAGSIPLLTAQLASLVVCMLLHYSDVISGGISIRTVIGVLAILYINIVICFYVEAIGAKNELEQEKEATEREYQYKLKYYESVKQSQEETRALWHEIQKYLNTMETLLGSQENEAASKCLLEANHRFHDLTKAVDVENPVLNGILNLGVQNAKKHNIPIHLDVWVNETLGVAPQDLFIILGNAIDNAIEECSQFSSKSAPEIRVSIHQKGQLLFIKVTNPCGTVPEKKPGKIHGYGLKNVQRCVNKYNGELQTGIENSIFHFFVLLNMK